MIAFTMLLFTVLEEAAAICTSILTIIGFALVVKSIRYYFLEFT